MYLKIKIPCAVVERLGIHSLFNFRRAEKGKKGEGGGVVCVCDVERKEKKKNGIIIITAAAAASSCYIYIHYYRETL